MRSSRHSSENWAQLPAVYRPNYGTDTGHKGLMPGVTCRICAFGGLLGCLQSSTLAGKVRFARAVWWRGGCVAQTLEAGVV